MHTASLRSAIGLVLCALLAGCGSPAAKFSGIVLVNGQPYHLDPSETFSLSFSYEVEPSYRRSSPAIVNPDGTFTVEMPDGKGFRLGKYQITATSTKYGPGIKSAERRDKFRKAFADPVKTPLTAEITPQTTEVLIDLGKKTVTAH